MILQYNKLSEDDKPIVAFTDNTCTAHLCEDHGVYLKIKGVSNYECPWCKTINDPIENIVELRKKCRKELAL